MKRKAAKHDIVDDVVEAHGVDQDKARAIIDTVLKSIVSKTTKHDMLILPGFGTFRLRFRKGFTTRNPRTGDPMPVAPTTNLTFKASKGVLDG